jgi:hypothetical protein
MLGHMRTTVRLDDAILQQAKQTAAARGVTLTSLIEKGLRMVMVQPIQPTRKKKVRLPVCRAGGGTLPGVDVSNSADLLDRMEGLS